MASSLIGYVDFFSNKFGSGLTFWLTTSFVPPWHKPQASMNSNQEKSASREQSKHSKHSSHSSVFKGTKAGPFDNSFTCKSRLYHTNACLANLEIVR